MAQTEFSFFFFFPSLPLSLSPRTSLSEIPPNLDFLSQGDSGLAGAGKPDCLLPGPSLSSTTSHVPNSRTQPGFDRADSAGP